MSRSTTSFALAVLLLPLASAAACSSSSTAPPAPPAKDPLAFDIATPQYTVQPGEEKRYMCFTTRLPADAETLITQIQPVYGKATHHLGVYYTLVDEPDGVSDCPQLVKQTWIPLYGGGIQSGTVTVPSGAAFHLAKGQQLLIQLHLLNSSQSVVTDNATIKFRKTLDPNAVPAGVFGMSNTQIALPPNSASDIAMDCKVNEPINAFAVFGHMHQLGTHIELSQTGGPVLFGEDWNFNDQPTVAKSFQLNTGDSLHLHCQYNNTTGQMVPYGESSYDEMCAFVVYYTPYPHLDGCQQ